MATPRKLLAVFSDLDVSKLAKAVSIIGVPALIALWLIRVITGNLVVDVAANKAMLTAHTEATAAMRSSLERFFLDQRERDKVIIALQRQQCVNTATDYQQRQACLQIQ